MQTGSETNYAARCRRLCAGVGTTGWASHSVDVVSWTADAGTVRLDIGLSDQRNKAQNAREVRDTLNEI
jgi:hypothetical protein